VDGEYALFEAGLSCHIRPSLGTLGLKWFGGIEECLNPQ
jgi:hypothetical protein